MKRLLAVAVAIAAVTMFSQSSAEAQHYGNGYQFGAGVSALNFGGSCGYNSREQLPYFAKFPPVYYSNIIARPVGISPYAAPAGITPVEMNYARAKQVTIANPYFSGKAASVKTIPAKKKAAEHKTTLIFNPYMDPVAIR